MIDPHAIIHSGAKIASGVEIGPFAIIGKNVEIGEGTKIGPHSVIEGYTKIGRNNTIYQFAAIGGPPQDKKYKGGPTFIEIGDNNIIREFCTIHMGTEGGRKVTKIGNDNYLMNYVHVAHDCILGDGNVFANNASLAGHVHIGSYVILSGFVKVAQFCSIGDYSFLGGDTGVIKDIPPYILVTGFKVYGLNVIGLKRNGFSDAKIALLKKAYNIIYNEHLTVKAAIPKLEALVSECKEVQKFIDMLQTSDKGIIR